MDELKERLMGEVKRRRIRFSKPAKEDKPLDDNDRRQFLDRFWADGRRCCIAGSHRAGVGRARRSGSERIVRAIAGREEGMTA
jgi:hypothetical protein